MSDQPYTPQARTDEDEEPEGAPRQTPQARAEETEEKEEATREGRPGHDEASEG